MSRSRWTAVLMLIALLSACGSSQQTAQAPGQPAGTPQQTAAATSAAPPTQPAVSPTLVPTAEPTVILPATQPAVTMPTAPIATEPPAGSATSTPTPAIEVKPTAVIAQGQEILTIPAGNDPGQVGVTAADGPPTFRIAADGSIRVMDSLNKRLLFFSATTSSQPFKLAQTIDLSFLKRPTDFVVTGKGDLYVLDAEGWTIDHLSIDGKELNNIPLNPATKGKFTTISLTADGRIMGLAGQTGYILVNAAGPIPLEDQPNAQVGGVVTVRSNAIFSIEADNSDQRRQVLQINYGDISPAGIALGSIDGQALFLDINQGMEPYTQVWRGTTVEIQRHSTAGALMGTLTVDLSGCRPAARGVYVDRPGDVYTMCVSDQDVTIKRYTMMDAQGQPLPRYDQLVESAPWSPGNLQSAPG